MDSAEVAEDRYARYVLAMESQNARGLLAQPGCAFGGRYLAMQMIVLPVIGRGDLGQQASYHLNDVGDRHLADLVLGPNVGRIAALPPRQ